MRRLAAGGRLRPSHSNALVGHYRQLCSQAGIPPPNPLPFASKKPLPGPSQLSVAPEVPAAIRTEIFPLSKRAGGELLDGSQGASAAAQIDGSKAAGSSSVMLQHQHKLPKLPIPSLEHTCKKFPQYIRPLVDVPTYERTRRIVDEFKSGVGRVLDADLRAWREESGVVNWLDEQWTEGYLGWRVAIPMNVNYGISFQRENLNIPLSASQAEVASKLVAGILQFRQRIVDEVLPPSMERTTPLDMSPMLKMFGSTRQPWAPRDRISHNYSSNTIAVLHRGHVYTVEVLGQDGLPVKEQALRAAFERIIAETKEDGPGLGRLGALDRDTFAEAYAWMLKDGNNRQGLQQLEAAMFAVCLDSTIAATDDAKARLVLHGDARNRWYDKNISLIVSADGKHVGFNNEHGWADGHPNTEMAHWVGDWLKKGAAGDKWTAERDTAEVHSLPLHVTAGLRKWLAQAETAAKALFQGTQVRLLRLPFGVDTIKKFGVSPDAFVQQAYHATAQRVFGRMVNAYESVMTRRYALGRTEAGRPVTYEAAVFSTAFNEGRTSRKELFTLFKRACGSHVGRLAECKEGNGIDRHLSGMYEMWARRSKQGGRWAEIPELFRCQAYLALKKDYLSTSTLGGPYMDIMSFGPTSEEGFGVGYSMKGHEVVVTATGRAGNGYYDLFVQELPKTFAALRELCEENVPKAVPKA